MMKITPYFTLTRRRHELSQMQVFGSGCYTRITRNWTQGVPREFSLGLIKKGVRLSCLSPRDWQNL